MSERAPEADRRPPTIPPEGVVISNLNGSIDPSDGWHLSAEQIAGAPTTVTEIFSHHAPVVHGAGAAQLWGALITGDRPGFDGSYKGTYD